MIKNIIFIAAYLLLIPAILAQGLSPDDRSTPDPLLDQNPDLLLSNQTGDDTMTESKTQPQIVIYTASYCPYCVKAKTLLTHKGIDFTEIDVTDPATRTDMISKAGGRRTIPQIFINEKHIGGCDDLEKMNKSGDLDKILLP